MGYPIYGGIQPQQMAPVMPQQFPTQQPMQPVQSVQPTVTAYPVDIDGKIWVQGLSGAKAYLVAPGRCATLWDTEEKVIYLKSADASGMPSMRIIDYKFRDEEKPVETPVEEIPKYVSIEDFNALKDELEDLRKQIKHNNVRSSENKYKNKEGGKL